MRKLGSSLSQGFYLHLEIFNVDNVLITKQGETINCTNAAHDYAAQRFFGITLRTFLKRRGGIRVKLCWPDITAIAIEYYQEPSQAQIKVIRKILRDSNFYTVILASRIIEKCRPVRSFKI